MVVFLNKYDTEWFFLFFSNNRSVGQLTQILSTMSGERQSKILPDTSSVPMTLRKKGERRFQGSLDKFPDSFFFIKESSNYQRSQFHLHWP